MVCAEIKIKIYVYFVTNVFIISFQAYTDEKGLSFLPPAG